jgi:capsule polysaccharide export protein KpsC/LpsZ
MSSMDKVAKRLIEAVADRQPPFGDMTAVRVADLKALLRDWNQLDNDVRLMYKPHHELLAGKVKKMDETLRELMEALAKLRAGPDMCDAIKNIDDPRRRFNGGW